MSRENIIVLVLALLFWAFSAVARWLREEMGKASSKGKPIEFDEWTPSSGFEVENKQEGKTPVIPILSLEGEEPKGPLQVAPKEVGRELMVKRLGLESPHSLRRGVILMAILGPCRALEPYGERDRGE